LDIVALDWKAAADREEAKDTLDLNVAIKSLSPPGDD
jgi:hypothetical protein